MHHSFLFQPVPSASDSEFEGWEAYQMTHQFYNEVHYRQEFEEYCQWHDAMAEHNRKEFESMKNDVNILGWFCRQ